MKVTRCKACGTVAAEIICHICKVPRVSEPCCGLCKKDPTQEWCISCGRSLEDIIATGEQANLATPNLSVEQHILDTTTFIALRQPIKEKPC